MLADNEQIEKELAQLKEEMKELTARKDVTPGSEEVQLLMKHVLEQRERTERMLASINNVMDKVRRMEQKLNSSYEEVRPVTVGTILTGKELAVSQLEAEILNFIKMQEHGMACADDIKSFMNYKGRNAACARLGKLMKEGLLSRMQIGRKVYYKFDTGKATNTLIISPPQ